MISCADAVKRLWDYLEEDLGEAERAQVEEHLAFCRRCCGEAEFAAELRAFMASAAHDDLPSDVRDHLEGFLANLEEEGTR